MSAVLALIGVFVTAAVTLVGYWLTRQADRRLEHERAMGKQRLAQEHRDELSRLRLDAAMRAAELFGPNDGVSATAASRATGLLALTRLNQADLAVALLVDMWSLDSGSNLEAREQVSTETAILVINAALSSEHPTSQLVAAELLCRNARRLDPCQSLHWPASIDGCWLPALSNKAKLLVIDGLVRMTVTNTANENALRSLVVRLHAISAGDPSPRMKGCVGFLITALLPALERLDYREFMHGNRTVTFDELRESASLASPNPDGYLERLVADRSGTLREWSSGCVGLSFEPGVLVTAAADL